MKRFSSSQLSLALSGLLVLLAASCRADREGEALLKRSMEAEARAKILQAEFSTQLGMGSETKKVRGTITLQKPNRAHIVMSDAGGEGDVVTHSDGKRLINLVNSEKQYTVEPPDLAGGNVVRYTYSMEARIFFEPDLLDRFRSLGTGVKVTGTQTIGGVQCKVLQAMGMREGQSRLYIDPDGIVRGLSTVSGKGDSRQTQDSRLTNVKVDAALPSNALAWTPPRAARHVEAITVSAESGGTGASPGSYLIQTGKPAPGFELTLMGGGRVAAASLFKSNRITLLNFWSYG
jgi:outer membrane lipoprotein-sorting protein